MCFLSNANYFFLLSLDMYFKISSIKITGRLKINTSIQSLTLRGDVPNIFAKNGTYNIKLCKKIETEMAPHNQRLSKSPITNKD
jgi:hypothetical protein